MTNLSPSILIIGATGFVGHALLKCFHQKGKRVRVLVRNPDKLGTKYQDHDVLRGDLLDPQSIQPALQGVKTIYYLVHALDQKQADFEQIEKLQSTHLASLTQPGQTIVYLSGLGHGDLSPHLKSRQEVGKYLATGKAKVVELRASIVIGEGSLSFELIRALVHRLPFIVTASWSKVASQPIALSDLVDILESAAEKKWTEQHCVIEIGGRDQVLYEDLLKTYAQIKGLSRPVLDIPQLPLKMAMDGLKIVTPEFATIGGRLLDSIEIPSVVQNQMMEKYFNIKPLGLEEAMKLCQGTNQGDDEEEQIEFLKKLKDSRQLSQLLKGSEFVEFFDLPFLAKGKIDLAAMVDFLRGPLKLLPGGVKMSGWDLQYADERLSAHFNFLLTGDFRIQLFHVGDQNDKLRLVIGFRPKYFYESAQWLIYTKISKFIFGQIQRLLKEKSGD